MSTVSEPLKYVFTGYFDDGKVLEQPADDRYSKHDDNAEHNKTAFTDLIEYQKRAKLIYFDINDGTFVYGIDLPSGRFGINGTWFSIEEQGEPLADRKVVYFREVEKKSEIFPDGTVVEGEPEITAYYFGYEGKNSRGKKVTKLIKVV